MAQNLHVENRLGCNFDFQHSGRSTAKLWAAALPECGGHFESTNCNTLNLRAQPMLKREDGARFNATIQTTSDGHQAAYVVSLQAEDHTLTETDVRLALEARVRNVREVHPGRRGSVRLTPITYFSGHRFELTFRLPVSSVWG
jgi:hypothetical protein